MKPARWLAKIHLKQYPPRTRSILFNGELVRMSFPCMSFGFDRYRGCVIAYVHDRPWKNYKDALKVLRLFPCNGHPVVGWLGAICLGEVKITEENFEEAFWSTGFSGRWEIQRNLAHYKSFPFRTEEEGLVQTTDAGTTWPAALTLTGGIFYGNVTNVAYGSNIRRAMERIYRRLRGIQR